MKKPETPDTNPQKNGITPKPTKLKCNIQELPMDDRPREKLMLKGAQGLSNAELLAILIGSGNRDENAVSLMQRLLKDCQNSLDRLHRMDLQTLTTYKGIGQAKAITIMAAAELARRSAQNTDPAPQIRSAQDAYNYIRPYLIGRQTEEVKGIFLNQANRIIATQTFSTGGITSSTIDVRVIIKQALLHNATGMILFHNHPSDNPTPGTADDHITQKLSKALSYMDIKLLDHIIVCTHEYYSYADHLRI